MSSVIEFQSVIRDGVIPIPKEYAGKIQSSAIQVAITEITANSPKKVKPFTFEDFSAIAIDTRSWKFDREEANERR
ncbi:hypothetical protein AGMMS50268_15680 [Spirochaetia bacterium]|nr:hypothetical protein AGMMS49546_25870 [Spirochaetia bacterium]GHV91065.1 hypothetical protein AGMMS50268_15680 [Spirochaetia bacterium]